MTLGACFVDVGWHVFHGFGVNRSPRAGVLCAAHVPRHRLAALAPPLLRFAEHPSPRLCASAVQLLSEMLRPTLAVESNLQAGSTLTFGFPLSCYLRTEENVVAARGSEVKEETTPKGVGGGHERTRAGAAFSTSCPVQAYSEGVVS